MEYISVKEAAMKWKVSERRVLQYCKEGRIVGLQRFGKSWAIPCHTEKPTNCAPSHHVRDPFVVEHSFELRESLHDIRVGAVITAAGNYTKEGEISPFTNICNLSLIRRIVISFQQAGVQTIVIVTGFQPWEIERHLATYGVIFLYNKDYETSDKFASSKVGLHFLEDKCDKVFFTSLKIPMILPDTLKQMIQDPNKLVVPRYNQKNGHPLLLDVSLIPEILSYRGTGGMRGAMASCSCSRNYIDVSDEGILLNAANMFQMEETLEKKDSYLLRPYVQLRIEKNIRFFDSRAKLLLFLIQEFHSVQSACKQMAISKGKAWDIITAMESELDMIIVKRQQGGSRDRITELTKEGEAFLQFYDEYESHIKQYAIDQFNERYLSFKQSLLE